MSHIFLSHSSTDEREAVALKQWLLDNGWDDIFLDLDPERGLKAGERWQEALRCAADRCEAVVFIISPAWAKSKWCLTEFLLAKSLHKLIFGIIVKETALSELPTELTSEYQLCRLIGEGSTTTIHFTYHENAVEVAFPTVGLNRLRLGLKNAGLSANFFPWPPPDDKLRAPYRGLEPFDKLDAAVFFGRDAEILEGLDKLRGMRADGNKGLFVILGASGAGKSSFLRAGLLPRLERDDRHFYLLKVIRPERSPLFGEFGEIGLAQAISQANNHLRLMPVNQGEIKSALNEGAERFGQLLGNIQNAVRAQMLGLPDDTPPPTLLLAVDQAEELFSADAAKEAHVFLDLIGDVLRATLPRSDRTSLSLIIAFTIRSDSYELLQTAPELMGLKTIVFDALKPMPREQFKEIITGPAIRASLSGGQLEIKPDLVKQLLDDCDHGGDTLPLLSLTLARLYQDYGSDGDLRLAEYQRMGGMANIIKTEIESILAADPEIRKGQLETLHAAFIPWLATINPINDQPMRRLAYMRDLPPASHMLVKSLVEKRLLLSDMRNGEQVLEVAHESLLRQWDMLAGWLLREEREDLKEADRLEQGAEAWNKNGRKSDWLIEGERLAISETLAAKPGYSKRLKSATEFLLASRQREAHRKEEEERQRNNELEREKARREAAEANKREADSRSEAANREKVQAELFANRSRKQKHIALIIALIAFISFLWAWIEEDKAELRELIAKADSKLNTDPQEGLLMALSAVLHASSGITNIYSGIHNHYVPLANKSLAKDALSVLHKALHVSRTKYVIDPDIQGLWSIAFSPDGMYMASGGVKGIVIVWKLEDLTASTWKTFRTFEHEKEVRNVAFSPDSKYLATASYDNIARVWNIQTREHMDLKDHSGRVRTIAFSPDGLLLATGSEDNTVILWDSKTGKAITTLTGHTSWIWSVSFSPPDGKFLATASSDKTVRIWSTESFTEKHKLEGHLDAVTGVAYSHDGELIATSSADRMARIWNVKENYTSFPLIGHNSNLWNVAFNSDSTSLATTGGDGTKLWKRLDNGLFVPLLNLIGQSGRGVGIAFDPDKHKHILVTANDDGTLRLWDISEKFELPLLKGHRGWVRGIIYNKKGNQLITVSEDKTIKFWDATTGKELEHSLDYQSPLRDLSLDSEGNRLATSSTDGFVTVWDISENTIRKIRQVRGNKIKGTGVALNPDGTMVATSLDDNTIMLWDVESGDPLKHLNEHTGFVNSLAYNSEGTLIATASDDMLIKIWDVNSGKRYKKNFHMSHAAPVRGVAFDPNGRLLVSVGADGFVKLWDLENSKEIDLTYQHNGEVRGVTFSKNGKYFASAGDDGKVNIWNVKMKAEEVTLEYPGIPFGVSFSPDESNIAVAGTNENVQIFTLNTEELVDLAIKRLSHTNDRSLKKCREYLTEAVCNSIQ